MDKIKFAALEGTLAQIAQAEARRERYVERWRKHYAIVKKHPMVREANLRNIERLIEYLATINDAKYWLKIPTASVLPPARSMIDVDQKHYILALDCYTAWLKLNGIQPN